ncbi:MAG: glycosyltransferase family 4 protein [Nitrososphaerota archaeon]|nr:glycosyltransferase family 4 protein [Candidatus Bathyarchaeota archaeon]MDW8194161.1 glycosyltransferase family 4 protein [Nitrososphaerota archaeon]
MNRIRVCVVTHLFLPHVGGIERVVYEQSKRLPMEEYEPIILTSDIYGKTNYTVDGLPVYCYPTLKVGFKLGIPYSIPKPSGFRLFLDQIKKCDIVHAHGHPYLSSYFAIKIAKRFAKPVILTQHNTFIEYGNFWDHAERINDAVIGRSNLQAADRIIVVSRATMNYVLGLGADPQKTEVLYNGVDLERFKPAPSMKTEFRKMLGIPEDYFVALTVRRLVYKNGIDFLLESARIAVKKNPRLLFLVIGGGPDFEKISDKISELKLEENFKLLGFISDEMLPQYYNASDVFVLPSKSGEGLPLVLLEAMACGLPVIATNVGGVPEIVNEVCGEIVQPDDALSLAESLVKFSHREVNFHRMEVRKFTEQRFDWNKNVKKLAEIYEELI